MGLESTTLLLHITFSCVYHLRQRVMESSRLEVRSEFKQNSIVISRVGVGGISVVSLYSSQQRPNNDTLYYMSHCLTACIYMSHCMYYMSLLSHCMYIHVLHVTVVSLHVYTYTTCHCCLTACIYMYYMSHCMYYMSLLSHCMYIHVLHVTVVSLHVYTYTTCHCCLTACIYMYYMSHCMYYMSLLSHCMYIHVLHVSLHVYTCTTCLTACIHVWVGYFTFLFFLISLNAHVFPCTTCLTACIHVLHVSLHVYMYCMSHWLSAWSELPAVWSQTCTFCSSHDESVCVSAESDPPDKHRSVKPPHREM